VTLALKRAPTSARLAGARRLAIPGDGRSRASGAVPA
jgi:hypothetical protein